MRGRSFKISGFKPRFRVKGRSWESSTDPLTKFLEGILTEDSNPTYLTRVLDADIVTMEELCKFIEEKHIHLSEEGIKNLTKIITERRPDLFNETIGEIFLEGIIRGGDDVEFVRSIIQQSGYVPDQKMVFGMPFGLFTEFFDENISMNDLIDMSNEVRDLDVRRTLIKKIMSEIVPSDLTDDNILYVLQYPIHISNGEEDIESFGILLDRIIDQLPDGKNILKTLILDNNSNQAQSVLIEYVRDKGIQFDPIDEDYIQYCSFDAEERYISHIGVSDRIRAYAPFVMSCIPPKIRKKYYYVSSVHSDSPRPHKDMPKISEDKLTPLLSPYDEYISIEEDSGILQAILTLMEEDPDINEYIRNNPPKPKKSLTDEEDPDINEYIWNNPPKPKQFLMDD